MNENINLCEILKDCPKGQSFYSSVYGKLIYSHMYINSSASKIYFTNPNCQSLVDSKPVTVEYCKNGRIYCTQGECTIFPSENQRDWLKFKVKKPKFDPKTLKSFDKIIYRFDNSGKWRCDFFSHMLTEKTLSVISTYYPIDFCIPYNDETKHLVGTKEEAPEHYKYWED